LNGAGVPPCPTTSRVPPRGRGGSLTPGALGRTAFSDDPGLAVASLQVRTFTLEVVDPADPLSVTLCWTDPPSPPGGGLQNKLYLRVQPPGGGAPVDDDVTPYNRASNPTQRVVIEAPVAGAYEIQVHGIEVTIPSAGAGVPAGNVQDFAVVVANATALVLVQ
jgi:serine protease AprX